MWLHEAVFQCRQNSLLLEMPSKTFRNEKKLLPDFKVSKDRLTLLLRANAVGELKVNAHLFRKSRALKNQARSTLPVLYKWDNKVWMIAHLLTTWFTDSFKPTVGKFCQKKRIPLNILLLNTPGHPRALMEIYNEIYTVLMFANTKSILQAMGQGVIPNFNSYYLRNMLVTLQLPQMVIPLMDLGKVK